MYGWFYHSAALGNGIVPSNLMYMEALQAGIDNSLCIKMATEYLFLVNCETIDAK